MPKQFWKYLLVLGLFFHTAIALTMGLISFGLAMAAALILYLRPIELQFCPPFSNLLNEVKLQVSKQTNEVEY